MKQIENKSLSKWFKASKLLLNFDKTHFAQFTGTNSPQIDLFISHANKLISEAHDTKFLGILCLCEFILTRLHTN
jgi:hypothetical protein